MKFLSTLILVFILCMNCNSQTVPSYVPLNGLKAWYPFNGNANDESGGGYNGLVYGATLTTDRFGHANSAYSFNANTIITNLPLVSGTNARTISFWFNPSQLNTSGNECLMLTGGNGSAGYGGDFSCMYYNDNPGLDIYNSFTSYQSSINTNTWYFYTITYSSNDGTDCYAPKIYINGTLLTTLADSYNASLSLNTSNNLFYTIGGNGVATQYFYGKLDDFGFWNRALTQSEITQLYAATLPIQLSNFNVAFKESKVFIDWETKNEVNGKCFNVQRSMNGKDFEVIDSGKIAVKGSNSHYNLIDKNVLLENNDLVYYRIEMIDNDGMKTYSEINSISIPKALNFQILPNPAKNIVSIKGMNIYQISLFDNSGKLLSINNFNNNDDKTIIDISKFKKGVYYIKVGFTSGFIQTQKLVVD